MAAHESFFFFAGQTCHRQIGFQFFNQQIIGDNIQFFLIFALHVAGTGFAEDTRQCALAYLGADVFAGFNGGGDYAAECIGQLMGGQMGVQEGGEGLHNRFFL